jgi:hypothetical protein
LNEAVDTAFLLVIAHERVCWLLIQEAMHQSLIQNENAHLMIIEHNLHCFLKGLDVLQNKMKSTLALSKRVDQRPGGEVALER